jgi:regulator of RNase E activity RraA
MLARNGIVLPLAFAASLASAQQPRETAIPDAVRLFIPYKAYSAEENRRVLELYSYLRVADISDGMDVVGLQDVGLVNPEIHALWKDTEKFTHRVIGIAVTARYVPTNKREPRMDDKTIGRWYGTLTSEAFMELLQPGSILVIDAMEDGESRSIGSSNILSWKKRGMLGLVTSGGLADTDEIIYHKVPTYFRRLARGIRPGRNELESVNRPVTIGGVLVRPGDVVAADGDGVVVVPRERAEEVAQAALPFLDNITRERYIKETGKNPWAKPGGAGGGSTMKLGSSLVLFVPDEKADADAASLAAHAKQGLVLARRDRGKGSQHLLVATSAQAAGPGRRVDYELVRPKGVGELPEVEVLGLHHAKVRPERLAEFDRFVAEKLHPAVGNLRPDLRLLYYKPVRGEEPGSYLTVFALSKASRDKYWPKGQDSDALRAAFDANVTGLAAELRGFLVEGSYATGNLAAAVYESTQWADYVIVPR